MPVRTLSRWSRDNPGFCGRQQRLSAHAPEGVLAGRASVATTEAGCFGVGGSRQTVSQAAQYHGLMSGSLGLMAPGGVDPRACTCP
jgi:hypothetical protein